MATVQQEIDWARRAVGDGAAEYDDKVLTSAFQAALRQLAQKRRSWACYRTTYPLALKEGYETGTISVSHGATTVTGSGTTFPTDIGGTALLYASGDSNPMRVATYTSGTEFELAYPYHNIDGNGLSGANYVLRYYAYALPSTIRRVDAAFLTNLQSGSGRSGPRPDPLTRISRQNLDQRLVGGETYDGEPCEYAVEKQQDDTLNFYIWPGVDRNYTLSLVVHQYPTPISESGGVYSNGAETLNVPGYLLNLFRALVLEEMSVSNASLLARAERMFAKHYQDAVNEDSAHAERLTFSEGPTRSAERAYQVIEPSGGWS